jgi:hypothetical protein
MTANPEVAPIWGSHYGVTGSSACGSGLEFVKQTQPNPRLAQRAGHYIMTNYFVAQSLSATWDSKMEFSDYAQGGRNGGSIEKRIH